MYKNEHMDITSADVPPEPPIDGGTPQTPTEGENAHMTYGYPQNILIHRGSQQMSVGGLQLKGRYPYRGGIREVS